MKKMISRQVCIYTEDWAKFQELKKKLGTGFSAFGRIAVHEYLDKVGEENGI